MRVEERRRGQAEQIREKLIDQLQTLTLLERELTDPRCEDTAQGVRADTARVAIGYLRQAIAALEAGTGE